MTLTAEVTVVGELLRAAAARQTSLRSSSGAYSPSCTDYLRALYTLYTVIIRTHEMNNSDETNTNVQQQQQPDANATRSELSQSTLTHSSEAAKSSSLSGSPPRSATAVTPSPISSSPLKGETLTLLVNLAIDHALKGLLTGVELQMWMCVLHEALQRHRCRQARQAEQWLQRSSAHVVQDALHSKKQQHTTRSITTAITETTDADANSVHDMSDGDDDTRYVASDYASVKHIDEDDESEDAGAHAPMRSQAHSLRQRVEHSASSDADGSDTVSDCIPDAQQHHGSDGTATLDELLQRPVQSFWQGIIRLTGRIATSRAIDWVTQSHTSSHKRAFWFTTNRDSGNNTSANNTTSMAQAGNSNIVGNSNINPHGSSAAVHGSSLAQDAQSLCCSLRLLRVLLMHTHTLTLSAERRHLPHPVRTRSAAVRASAMSALPHLIRCSAQSIVSNSSSISTSSPVALPSSSPNVSRSSGEVTRRLTEDFLRYILNGLSVNLRESSSSSGGKESTNSAAVALASVRALRELIELAEVNLDAATVRSLLRPLMKLCQTATAIGSNSLTAMSHVTVTHAPDECRENADSCVYDEYIHTEHRNDDGGNFVRRANNDNVSCSKNSNDSNGDDEEDDGDDDDDCSNGKSKHSGAGTNASDEQSWWLLPSSLQFQRALRECDVACFDRDSLCSTQSPTVWSVCSLIDPSIRLSDDDGVGEVYVRLAEEAAVTVGYLLCFYQTDFVARTLREIGSLGEGETAAMRNESATTHSTSHAMHSSSTAHAHASSSLWCMLGSHSGDVAQAAEVRRVVLLLRGSTFGPASVFSASVSASSAEGEMSAALQRMIASALCVCVSHTATLTSTAAAVRSLFVLLIPTTREVQVSHVPCILIAAITQWARDAALDSVRVALVRALLGYCVPETETEQSLPPMTAPRTDLPDAIAATTDKNSNNTAGRMITKSNKSSTTRAKNNTNSSAGSNSSSNGTVHADPERLSDARDSTSTAIDAAVSRVVCHTALSALHAVCTTLCPIPTVLAQDVAAVLQRVSCGRGRLVSDILAALAQRSVTFESSLLQMCTRTLVARTNNTADTDRHDGDHKAVCTSIVDIRSSTPNSDNIHNNNNNNNNNNNSNTGDDNSNNTRARDVDTARASNRLDRPAAPLTAPPSVDCIIYIRAILAVPTSNAALTACRLSALIYLSLQQPLARARPDAGDFIVVECLLRLATTLLYPSSDRNTSDDDEEQEQDRDSDENTCSVCGDEDKEFVPRDNRNGDTSHIWSNTNVAPHRHHATPSHHLLPSFPVEPVTRSHLNRALRRRIRFCADMHVRLLVSRAQRSVSSVRAAVAGCVFLRHVCPARSGDGALAVALLEGQLTHSSRHRRQTPSPDRTVPSSSRRSTAQERAVAPDATPARYDAWMSQLTMTVYDAVTALSSVWIIDGGSVRWLLTHCVNDIVHAFLCGAALREIWTHRTDAAKDTTPSWTGQTDEASCATAANGDVDSLAKEEGPCARGAQCDAAPRAVHPPPRSSAEKRSFCAAMRPYPSIPAPDTAATTTVAVVALHALRLLASTLNNRHSTVARDVAYVARVLQRIDEGFDAAAETVVRRASMMVVMYGIVGQAVNSRDLAWRDHLCRRDDDADASFLCHPCDHRAHGAATHSAEHRTRIGRSHRRESGEEAAKPHRAGGDATHGTDAHDAAVLSLRRCGQRWRRRLVTWRSLPHAPISHRVLLAILTSRMLLYGDAATAEESVNRYTVQAAHHRPASRAAGGATCRSGAARDVLTVALAQCRYAGLYGCGPARTRPLASAWLRQMLQLRQPCGDEGVAGGTDARVAAHARDGGDVDVESVWHGGRCAAVVRAHELRMSAVGIDSAAAEAAEEDEEEEEEEKVWVSLALAVCALTAAGATDTDSAELRRQLGGGVCCFGSRALVRESFMRLILLTLWSEDIHREGDGEAIRHTFEANSYAGSDSVVEVSAARAAHVVVVVAAVSTIALSACFTAIGAEGMGWVGGRDGCAASRLLRLLRELHARRPRHTNSHTACGCPRVGAHTRGSRDEPNHSRHRTCVHAHEDTAARRDGDIPCADGVGRRGGGGGGSTWAAEDDRVPLCVWFLRESLPRLLRQFEQQVARALTCWARRILPPPTTASPTRRPHDAAGQKAPVARARVLSRRSPLPLPLLLGPLPAYASAAAAALTRPAVWTEWVWWAMRCTVSAAPLCHEDPPPSRDAAAAAAAVWPFCVWHWSAVYDRLADARARQRWRWWAVWNVTPPASRCCVGHVPSMPPTPVPPHRVDGSARRRQQRRPPPSSSSRPLWRRCPASARRWARDGARILRDSDGRGLDAKAMALFFLWWIMATSCRRRGTARGLVCDTRNTTRPGAMRAVTSAEWVEDIALGVLPVAERHRELLPHACALAHTLVSVSHDDDDDDDDDDSLAATYGTDAVLRATRVGVAVRSLLQLPHIPIRAACALLRALVRCRSPRSARGAGVDAAARRATRALIALLWVRQAGASTPWRECAAMVCTLRWVVQRTAGGGVGGGGDDGAGVDSNRDTAAMPTVGTGNRYTAIGNDGTRMNRRTDATGTHHTNNYHDWDAESTRSHRSTIHADRHSNRHRCIDDTMPSRRWNRTNCVEEEAAQDSAARAYRGGVGWACSRPVGTACVAARGCGWPLTHHTAWQDGLSCRAAQAVLACWCAHLTATLALREHRRLVPHSTATAGESVCVADDGWELSGVVQRRRRRDGWEGTPAMRARGRQVDDRGGGGGGGGLGEDGVRGSLCRVWRTLAVLCNGVAQLDLPLRQAAGDLACMTLAPVRANRRGASETNCAAADGMGCVGGRAVMLSRFLCCVIPRLGVHHRRCLVELTRRILGDAGTVPTSSSSSSLAAADCTEDGDAVVVAGLRLWRTLALDEDAMDRQCVWSTLRGAVSGGVMTHAAHPTTPPPTPPDTASSGTIQVPLTLLHVSAVLYARDAPHMGQDVFVDCVTAVLRRLGVRRVLRVCQEGWVCGVVMAAALQELPADALWALAVSDPAALLFVEHVVGNTARQSDAPGGGSNGADDTEGKMNVLPCHGGAIDAVGSSVAGYSLLSQSVVSAAVLRQVRAILLHQEVDMDAAVRCLLDGCRRWDGHVATTTTTIACPMDGEDGAGASDTSNVPPDYTDAEEDVEAARIAVVVSVLLTCTSSARGCVCVSSVVARLLHRLLCMRFFVKEPYTEQRVMWIRWCVRGVLLPLLPPSSTPSGEDGFARDRGEGGSDDERVGKRDVGDVGGLRSVGERWMRCVVPRYPREMRTVVGELNHSEAQRMRRFFESSNMPPSE